MKKLVLLILLLLAFPSLIAAKYDPRTVPNNQFGIHVADPNDIPGTAQLLNSSGGDWGYVTIVIPETDRNSDKWQAVFDQMRRLHLIPLVRLASRVEGAAWTIPSEESLRDWVDFLSRLTWPTENRYVIVFNEPNHAKEWGNTIDPEGYARILAAFARALRNASEDFFILPAGMDVSAHSDGSALDAAEYWRRMVAAQPDVLALLDGWTSHSYPNPGFSGSPAATGRGTVWSFAWELSYLSGMGLDRDLPVFITETGWVHEQGKLPDFSLLSTADVAANIRTAAAGPWSDGRVVAVTPFVFSYQDIPFDHFSWKRLGGEGFYEHYDIYRQIIKTRGTPRQRHEFRFAEELIPAQLVAGSTYTLEATITNSGQSILTPGEFAGRIELGDSLLPAIFDPLPTLEPGQSGTVRVHLQTPPAAGMYDLRILFFHNEQEIEISSSQLSLVPPPSVRIAAQLGWKRTSNADDVTVLVYDDKDILLHKFPGLRIEEGVVRATGLTNIIPGRNYRVVVLAPSYLPRQVIAPLAADETLLTMRRFLPLDLDRNGHLSLGDLWAAVTSPPRRILPLVL